MENAKHTSCVGRVTIWTLAEYIAANAIELLEKHTPGLHFGPAKTPRRKKQVSIPGVRRITDPSGPDIAGVVTILASADHRPVTQPIDGAPCTSLDHTSLSQGGEGLVARPLSVRTSAACKRREISVLSITGFDDGSERMRISPTCRHHHLFLNRDDPCTAPVYIVFMSPKLISRHLPVCFVSLLHIPSVTSRHPKPASL